MSPRRKALIAVAASVACFLLLTFLLGRENFWFTPTLTYRTQLPQATGLRVGTKVSYRGILVGKVSQVSVSPQSGIILKFVVTKEIEKKITVGSEVRVVRSNLVGDKKLELVTPKEGGKRLPEGQTLPGQPSREIIDLLTGDKIGGLVGRMEHLGQVGQDGLDYLANLLEKLQVKDLEKLLLIATPTLQSFAGVLQELHPILIPLRKNKNSLGPIIVSGEKTLQGLNRQLLGSERLGHTMENLRLLTGELAQNRQTLLQIMSDLQVIAKEVAQRPELTAKVVSTLDELSVTLRALQKTWILETHVQRELKKGGAKGPLAPLKSTPAVGLPQR